MLTLLKKEITKLKHFFFNPTFFFVTIAGNTVMVLTTVIVYFLEKDVNPHITSYFDSLWWGLSTITTVGYGDIVPITFWGKTLGMALMFFGTVLFITFTGILVSCWMKDTVQAEMDPLEKQVLKEEFLQSQMNSELTHISRRLDKIEEKFNKF